MVLESNNLGVGPPRSQELCRVGKAMVQRNLQGAYPMLKEEVATLLTQPETQGDITCRRTSPP